MNVVPTTEGGLVHQVRQLHLKCSGKCQIKVFSVWQRRWYKTTYVHVQSRLKYYPSPTFSRTYRLPFLWTSVHRRTFDGFDGVGQVLNRCKRITDRKKGVVGDNSEGKDGQTIEPGNRECRENEGTKSQVEEEGDCQFLFNMRIISILPLKCGWRYVDNTLFTRIERRTSWTEHIPYVIYDYRE